MEKFSNTELLNHYYDACCDSNYNPTNRQYNQSGFTFDELENEILNRMSNAIQN